MASKPVFNARKSCLTRSVAAGTALLFLGSTVLSPWAEASFWQDRRKAVESSQRDPEAAQQFAQLPRALSDLNGALPRVANSFPDRQALTDIPSVQTDGISRKDVEHLPSWLTSLPATYGDIQKIRLVTRPEEHPLVVLVQDAHEIYSAQLNISHVLEHLDKNSQGQRLLIGLEGAAGPLDLKTYRRSADRRRQAIVSDVLLETKLLSGPEHFGFTAEREPRMLGVETPTLYIENVQAYQELLPRKDAFKEQLSAFDFSLKPAKDKFFSLTLWALDENIASYHKGSLDLLHYVKFLSKQVELGKDFPETRQLLDVLALEDSLDFKAVESERLQLVKILSHRLDKAALNGLLQASLAYKMGRISYGAYHEHLRILTRNAGVDLSRFPGFNVYIQYVLLSEKIDKYTLFDEVNALKETVVDRLGSSQGQKELLRLSEDIRLLESLSEQQFGPTEWERYSARRDEILRIPQRIAALSHDAQPSPSAVASFQETLPLFERFYRAADARNGALIGNLLEGMQPAASGQTAAVIVVGGFHAPAIEKLLGDKNISVVTVTPKVGPVDKASRYLDVFALKHVPLEKMFLGEKLYMAPVRLTGTNEAMAAIQPARTTDDLKRVYLTYDYILDQLGETGRKIKAFGDLDKHIESTFDRAHGVWFFKVLMPDGSNPIYLCGAETAGAREKVISALGYAPSGLKWKIDKQEDDIALVIISDRAAEKYPFLQAKPSLTSWVKDAVDFLRQPPTVAVAGFVAVTALVAQYAIVILGLGVPAALMMGMAWGVIVPVLIILMGQLPRFARMPAFAPAMMRASNNSQQPEEVSPSAPLFMQSTSQGGKSAVNANSTEETRAIKAWIREQLDLMSEELGKTPDTYEEILRHSDEALTAIAQRIIDGTLNRHAAINVDPDAPPVKTTDEELNIGVYAVAANPLHWGHILLALDAVAYHGVDQVVFIPQGEDERKPDLDKLNTEQRHEIVPAVLANFAPFFKYSPLGLGNKYDGETNVFRLFKMNPNQRMRLHYMVGADHFNVFVLNKAGRWVEDTVAKLSKNLLDPARIAALDNVYQNNPLHRLTALFIARIEKGRALMPRFDQLEAEIREASLTNISFADQESGGSIAHEQLTIHVMKGVQFEASSTMVRNGDYSLVPYHYYMYAKARGMYKIPPTPRWKMEKKPTMRRLDKITGFLPDGVAPQGIYSMEWHLRWTANITQAAAKELQVSTNWAEFLAMVHDLSDWPFRHFGRTGDFARVIDAAQRAGYNQKVQTVELLAQDGVYLTPEMVKDIIHFDISNPNPTSPEQQAALIVDSLMSVMSDIVFGLTYRVSASSQDTLITYDQIPEDLRTLFNLRETTLTTLNEQSDNNIGEMVQVAVLNAVSNLYREVESSQETIEELERVIREIEAEKGPLDDKAKADVRIKVVRFGIYKRAGQVKQQARANFISDLLYKPMTAEYSAAASDYLMRAYEKTFGVPFIGDGSDDEKAREFLVILSRMSEDEVIALADDEPARSMMYFGGAAVTGALGLMAAFGSILLVNRWIKNQNPDFRLPSWNNKGTAAYFAFSVLMGILLSSFIHALGAPLWIADMLTALFVISPQIILTARMNLAPATHQTLTDEHVAEEIIPSIRITTTSLEKQQSEILALLTGDASKSPARKRQLAGRVAAFVSTYAALDRAAEQPGRSEAVIQGLADSVRLALSSLNGSFNETLASLYNGLIAAGVQLFQGSIPSGLQIVVVNAADLKGLSASEQDVYLARYVAPVLDSAQRVLVIGDAASYGDASIAKIKSVIDNANGGNGLPYSYAEAKRLDPADPESPVDLMATLKQRDGAALNELTETGLQLSGFVTALELASVAPLSSDDIRELSDAGLLAPDGNLWFLWVSIALNQAFSAQNAAQAIQGIVNDINGIIQTLIAA